MKRYLATALVFAVAALAGAAPAPAVARDNTAVAVNQRDDSSVFELAFSIEQLSEEIVDETNAAVAYASCERCQTVAIAIQVLIVTVSPTTLTPTNVALAINENCTSCVTMALAYQFVMGGGPVELTPRGRRALERIRRELRRLRRRGLTHEQIRARTGALVEQLQGVLDTELVPAGDGHGGRPPGDDEPSEDADTDDGEEPAEEAPPEPLPTETTPTDTEPKTTPETTAETAPEEPLPAETAPEEPPPPAEEQPAPQEGTETTTTP
jgi:putative peptide zinc metalloprotease protein